MLTDTQPAGVNLGSIVSKAMVAFIGWYISLLRGITLNLKLIKELTRFIK